MTGETPPAEAGTQQQASPAEKDRKGCRDEMLRRQYEQVCISYRAIDDFRGKLLALWPILGGAAGGVALLASRETARNYLWAVGFFGTVVSIGLAVYEWNQTLRCGQLKQVGQRLESEMGLEKGMGQFLTVPDGFPMTFRTIVLPEPRPFSPIRTGLASFIVYVAVILAWIGLFLWGAFLFVWEVLLQLG